MKFAKPDPQAKLAKHNSVETYLLIHGGWNAYVSNSPHHSLTLAWYDRAKNREQIWEFSKRFRTHLCIAKPLYGAYICTATGCY